jgi:aconitase A
MRSLHWYVGPHGCRKAGSNTIVHSFNRNFAKRADGNPNTLAFVASVRSW